MDKAEWSKEVWNLYLEGNSLEKSIKIVRKMMKEYRREEILCKLENC